MGKSKKISELEKIGKVSGREELAVAIDGQNYKVTPDQMFKPGYGLELDAERNLNVNLDLRVFTVVDVLPDAPADGDENKIHLIHSAGSEEGNVYVEWLFVNGEWEKLGEFVPTSGGEGMDMDFSKLEPLDALSGKEAIPVELDGKNYKITPDQIAPFVDIANIPTFDSITGQEKVIVVRDGKAQGLVTLTQIRQVVLPGYTYEDLSMDKFPMIIGSISGTGVLGITANNHHIEIPITEKNMVFVISLLKVNNGYQFTTKNVANFGFTKESLSGKPSDYKIEFCDTYEGNASGFYSFNEIGETVTIVAPDDAKFLVINVIRTVTGVGIFNFDWSIQVGELIITTRLNDLENRVNLIEHSPAPANLDGVSREEFDALKRELDSLKAQNTAVVSKSTTEHSTQETVVV